MRREANNLQAERSSRKREPTPGALRNTIGIEVSMTTTCRSIRWIIASLVALAIGWAGSPHLLTLGSEGRSPQVKACCRTSAAACCNANPCCRSHAPAPAPPRQEENKLSCDSGVHTKIAWAQSAYAALAPRPIHAAIPFLSASSEGGPLLAQHVRLQI